LNLEEEKQMGKFITFGEIMLRLAPMNFDRFLQSKEFGVVYGGGEANVAVSLANYGKDAYFVTKLPTHEIGQSAVNELRRYGVDTSKIVRGGDRVGIYFCEKGASQRPSKVIYDRAHSAIAEAKREDFNWKEIFADAEWFHFTGITPALSDECAAITLDAVKAAKEAGVTVSVDLNFRKKLWSSEKAGQVMGEIVKYCDVVIANEEDAEKVFGIKAEETDITGGTLSNEGYQNVARQLVERFDLKYVAITLRESFSASDNGWSAMLYDGKEFYNSKKYKMHIVDRVGGGDSFGAGLIYGLTSGLSNQDSLEYAVAASCLKHTIEGDFNLVSIEEVETLMKGDASGRVQR
jgi:2-dehydro-3-deoxygluconokinase